MRIFLPLTNVWLEDQSFLPSLFRYIDGKIIISDRSTSGLIEDCKKMRK